jgi:predicted RNA binding protein YcfA (HicA-like mRNA interferase family)
MPKPFSLRKLLKILKERGFFLNSQKGSHAKYKNKDNSELIVIIPLHGKEIPHGTLRSILRQAKIDFKDLDNK